MYILKTIFILKNKHLDMPGTFYRCICDNAEIFVSTPSGIVEQHKFVFLKMCNDGKERMLSRACTMDFVEVPEHELKNNIHFQHIGYKDRSDYMQKNMDIIKLNEMFEVFKRKHSQGEFTFLNVEQLQDYIQENVIEYLEKAHFEHFKVTASDCVNYKKWKRIANRNLKNIQGAYDGK